MKWWWDNQGGKILSGVLAAPGKEREGCCEWGNGLFAGLGRQDLREG
jgi:hypothetical protein